jgi:antiviral defense system Shedu protein SduA
MKTFEPLVFDPARCLKEVGELRKWLGRRAQLDEQKHIRPFFRKRRHLSAFIASYSSNVIRFDRIAFEYPLFGDFSCDLAIGDSVKKAYCFVEFEDAGPNSLFVKQAKKATREWSPRFDHGCSQVIDWFYKLEDMKKSHDFAARFGAPSISCTGILIIGRDQFLLSGEKERLDWRRNNVVVASQTVQCVTFDGLVEDLEARLTTFPLSAKAGG